MPVYGRVLRVLAAAGITDAIKPKLKPLGRDSGQELVAKGELDLAPANAGEVRSFVKFAGYFPAQLRDYINYEAAITNKVAAPSAATALVEMMTSAAAAPHWRAARLEPHTN